MHILKSIGIGKECVYVYYYPNDKLLADVLGRDIWECKVGMTSTGDSLSRILAQMGKTSRHQDPVIALEIRTDNAIVLESKIHRVFYKDRLPHSRMSGDEWFLLNPEKIENYIINGIDESSTKTIIDDAYIINDSLDLSKTIRKIRKQRRLPQGELGVARGTIIKFEFNKSPVQTDNLLRILEKLDCRLAIIPIDNL